MLLREIFDNPPASIDDQINMFEAYFNQLLQTLENQFPGRGSKHFLVASRPKCVFVDIGVGIYSTGVSLAGVMNTNKAAIKFKEKVEALPDYKQVCRMWVEQKYKSMS